MGAASKMETAMETATGREKQREGNNDFGLRHNEIRERFHQRSKGGNFSQLKDFGLGRLPTCANMLQEVGILPILVYFSFLGMKMGISSSSQMIFRLGELSFT